jgi:hypothetical protein
MLQDEQAAGKVIVPLKPFLRFSRRMDRQLARLRRRIWAQIPQLARRGQQGRRERPFPLADSSGG